MDDPHPSNKQSDDELRDFITEIFGRLIAFLLMIVPFVVLL